VTARCKVPSAGIGPPVQERSDGPLLRQERVSSWDFDLECDDPIIPGSGGREEVPRHVEGAYRQVVLFDELPRLRRVVPKPPPITIAAWVAMQASAIRSGIVPRAMRSIVSGSST